jgi:hypothetical protein
VLAAEEARVAGFVQHHATERATLEAERQQAFEELGKAVLPRLDAASIAAAGQAVGLLGLAAEDILRKVEARRAWLVSRLHAIVHDPRYANRELQRHPRTGSLTTAIAQNEEHRRPSAAVIAACEGHPRFHRLWTIGFGTPEQTTPWWRYRLAGSLRGRGARRKVPGQDDVHRGPRRVRAGPPGHRRLRRGDREPSRGDRGRRGARSRVRRAPRPGVLDRRP